MNVRESNPMVAYAIRVVKRRYVRVWGGDRCIGGGNGGVRMKRIVDMGRATEVMTGGGEHRRVPYRQRQKSGRKHSQ